MKITLKNTNFTEIIPSKCNVRVVNEHLESQQSIIDYPLMDNWICGKIY